MVARKELGVWEIMADTFGGEKIKTHPKIVVKHEILFCFKYLFVILKHLIKYQNT